MKNMFRRVFIFTLIHAVSITAIVAQQRFELTVGQAVEMAFKNIASIKNAQLDILIQEAKNKEMIGQALPQIAGAASITNYPKTPQILFPDYTDVSIYTILKNEGVKNGSGVAITNIPSPSTSLVSFVQPWQWSYGPVATQILFQPDVFVGLLVRKTAVQYYKNELEKNKIAIKDSAYRRYYAILITEQQLKTIDQSVLRLEKLYHDDSVMYQTGLIEKLDVDKVNVQLTNLKTNQSQISMGLKLAYAALKLSIGVSQKDEVVLKESLTMSEVKKDVLDDTGFNYTDRIEVKSLMNAKRLQGYQIKRYQLGYLPTLTATGNYSKNFQGQKLTNNAEGGAFNYDIFYVGLNMNLPVFDGFQKKQKINQARYELQKLDNNLTYLKQAIDLEQLATKETLNVAIQNLNSQDANMKLAENVYNKTKIKFEQGVGSSFEVLQADTDLEIAQLNYFNALYNAVLSKISYLKSIGKF